MEMRRPEEGEEDDDGGGAVAGEGPSDEDMRHVRGQETMLRCHVWSCLHQVEVCGALRLHDSNDSGTSQVPISPLFQLYYSSTYYNYELVFKSQSMFHMWG